MRATSTRIVDFRDLQQKGRPAVIIVKLMMTGNDLALANECLSRFKEEQPRLARHRQMGARIYFLCLQLAHLAEAMNVLEEVEDCPELQALIRGCPPAIQDAHAELRRFLRSGAEREKFEKCVIQVRNNIAFHYQESGKLIERALADRASRAEARFSTVTRGSVIDLWRFTAADHIIDSIICRQIWKVPRTADDRAEVDKVAAYALHILVTYLDFVGEITWRFLSSG